MTAALKAGSMPPLIPHGPELMAGFKRERIRTSGAEIEVAVAGKGPPLLLIHGMSDDNVVFDSATACAAAMQRGARPFEMMFYPGQTHRVGGPGISEHLWTTILGFLDRRMPAKK